jgi:probable phosphoglycerate mutase
MKVYVMRHGTTVWNERGITQGRTNNRLSKQGKLLTEEVARKYKDINFDVIFASPLMRTMQTANIINKYHGAKIIKDERLIEIDQGIFSGKGKNEITEEEKKLKFARAKECGMESYQSVYERIANFVQELKQNKKAFRNIMRKAFLYDIQILVLIPALDLNIIN